MLCAKTRTRFASFRRCDRQKRKPSHLTPDNRNPLRLGRQRDRGRGSACAPLRRRAVDPTVPGFIRVVSRPPQPHLLTQQVVRLACAHAVYGVGRRPNRSGWRNQLPPRRPPLQLQSSSVSFESRWTISCSWLMTYGNRPAGRNPRIPVFSPPVPGSSRPLRFKKRLSSGAPLCCAPSGFLRRCAPHHGLAIARGSAPANTQGERP